MTELDVALVAPNVERGDGQGQAMLQLALALAARGHRVTVYAHRLEPGVALAHRKIPDPPGPRLVADLVFFAVVSLALRRRRHDVSCVMGPCAIPPRPFVYYAQFSHSGWRRTWVRGAMPSGYHRLHSRLSGWLERRIAGRADRTLSCSTATGVELETAGERLAIVPNGVDPDRFVPVTDPERHAARRSLGLAPEPFVVAFVGEYHTNRKGLDTLLAAVAAGDEHLVVAGSGPGRALTRKVRRLGCADRVRAVGFCDARTVIAAADAVAVPSRYEPFSIVALEAAASGVPLILSSRAGAAEHLADAAYLVDEPVDAPAVRRALDRLRSAPPAERAARVAAGRAAAERLAWPTCADRAAVVVEQAAPAPACVGPVSHP